MDPSSFQDVFGWLWGLTGEPHFHSTIILLGYAWLSRRTKKMEARVTQQDVEIVRLQKQIGHLMNVIGMRKHESRELGAYLPLPKPSHGTIADTVPRPDMRRKPK